MKKIKFTNGTLCKVDENYYDLKLYHNDSLVYSATVNNFEAVKFTLKYNSITII